MNDERGMMNDKTEVRRQKDNAEITLYSSFRLLFSFIVNQVDSTLKCNSATITQRRGKIVCLFCKSYFLQQ